MTRLAFALAFVLSATPLAAEPIQITSGRLDGIITSGTLTLAGDGFTFEGGVRHGPSPLESCRPCAPGELLSVNAGWVGSDIRGHVVLNGTNFPDVGSERSLSAQSLMFTGGSWTIPAVTSNTASLMMPFDFSGWFSVNEVGLLPPGNPPPPPNIRVDLAGSGTATVNLTRSESVWVATSATYLFGRPLGTPPDDEMDPVPEPASMILLGTGLTGLAYRLRKRRQAS